MIKFENTKVQIKNSENTKLGTTSSSEKSTESIEVKESEFEINESKIQKLLQVMKKIINLFLVILM
jgi:hypothetical protein